MTRAQIEYLVFICLMLALAAALTVGLDRALRRRPKGHDVGLDLFRADGPELCCEEGCDECGAPMAFEDCTVVPVEFIDYGSTIVHRPCLEARRDGRPVCEHCAPILAGAA